jgi:hypothetical protein
VLRVQEVVALALAVRGLQTQEVVVEAVQEIVLEAQRLAAMAALVSLSSKSHRRTMPHSHLV